VAIVTPTRLRKVEDLNSLLEISAAMNSEKDLASLLSLIVEETTKVLDAERTTLYLYDPDTQELWSLIAQGEDMGEIRLRLGEGLAGYVAQTKESIKIDEAYSDPRFNKEIDKKTGFVTRNMLVVPLLNLKDEVGGVMQVMNKKLTAEDAENAEEKNNKNRHKGSENELSAPSAPSAVQKGFSDMDMELLHALATHAAVAIEKQNLYEENEKFLRSIVKVLAAAVDARDPVTAGHSERVAKYSANLARALGMRGDDARLVEYAAYLHDVGKIGVPDAVLNKPGKLDAQEFEQMKSHAVRTREILSEAYFPRNLRSIPEVAASHHEKLDGSGYPEGLSGDDISQVSRLMAIADIFDALVAQDRPYKPALPRLKAFQILREEARKGRLDSELVELFIREKQYEIE
jgi:putative nucleotidyltransferase with HDIG domain